MATRRDVSSVPTIDRLSRAIGDRLAWLFLLSATLTCYEVLMDWLFRAPTIWVHDSTSMMSATCFLFGGAYAMGRREHIRITFIYDALSRRVRWVCDLIALAVALVYLLALSWFAGGQAIRSILIVEMSGRAWDFPMPMVIRTAFFLGVALLSLQTLAHLVALLRERR